jgi:hypothetical protein
MAFGVNNVQASENPSSFEAIGGSLNYNKHVTIELDAGTCEQRWGESIWIIIS